MSGFEYLQNWYRENCDGDWEHQFGVRINTVDNPGWQVSIDLANTNMEHLEIEYVIHETSSDDWYGYSVKDSIFNGAGDTGKLEKLFDVFREMHLGQSN